MKKIRVRIEHIREGMGFIGLYRGLHSAHKGSCGAYQGLRGAYQVRLCVVRTCALR